MELMIGTYFRTLCMRISVDFAGLFACASDEFRDARLLFWWWGEV